MQERGEDDADRYEEDETAVQRVHPGEDLPGWRLRRVDRSHAAEQHGRVQERVPPGELLEVRVAAHPEDKRSQNQSHRSCDVGCEPAKEPAGWNRARSSMLVHTVALSRASSSHQVLSSARTSHATVPLPLDSRHAFDVPGGSGVRGGAQCTPPAFAHAENYRNGGLHPSLGSYITLEAGDKLGITFDAAPADEHEVGVTA